LQEIFNSSTVSSIGIQDGDVPGFRHLGSFENFYSLIVGRNKNYEAEKAD
jgi:hypothetical protein